MKNSTINELHDRDFNLWVQQMVIAVKNRDFAAMDWANLLDEIEDMGASQKRALRSFVQRLIEHIFKLRYWTEELERNQKGWKSEVINFRTEVENILEESPSLKNYLNENYLRWYDKSLKKYQKNNLFKVPNHEPIPLEKILDEEFFG